MKKLLYMIALVIGIQSCEKESFNYEKYQAKTSDVSSIYFSTGSNTLVADGKASLQFVLQAFRNIQTKDETGQQVESRALIDLETLPDKDVKIFVDGKEVDGNEYSTTDLSKTTLACYAQIGDIKSEVKNVTIRKPVNIGAKRYVDVVFHVLEMNPTDYLFDPLTYQEVTPKQLNDAIAYANQIFNNEIGKDPNGGSANIEFRLATKNPAGVSLPIAGYNKITYDNSWKAAGALHTTAYTVANFTNKINTTVSYQWNKDKFLNIYVIPTSSNNSVGSFRAGYQIVGPGQVAIEGIAKTVNSESDVPTTDFYNNYGLGLHRATLFPDPSRKIEIASYLGIYYGLYQPHSTGSTVVDYVADTRKYLSGDSQPANVSGGLLKVGIDGEMFLANNAMDDIRYASLRNSFTIGQANRMRLVMERSPVRKAWTLQ